MTGRQVTPLNQLARRIPDAGRIRIGTSKEEQRRGGKGTFYRPVKLSAFRFTGADPVALQQVADLYGGTVLPWKHPKTPAGQIEVVTTATEIRIALPPDPLGNTPIYEMWGGGGCERRCDGETCEMLTSSQDGLDLQQAPCLCLAAGELACKVTTRLSVLLPEIRFVGVWRLDSHGWNAAQELPGMVELIRSLQDRGIVRGLLRVEERVQVLAGETRKYMVPVLGIDESVEALAAGVSRMGALSTAAPAGEIGPGDAGDREAPEVEDGAAPSPLDVTTSPGSSDDEIVDAEIVEDGDPLAHLVEVCSTATKKAKALRAARTAAEHGGLVLPLTFEEITDPLLAVAALSVVS